MKIAILTKHWLDDNNQSLESHATSKPRLYR